MTATEINEVIGLPKQTIHRLCATLEAEGFLIRRDGSKRYHVARRLRELGMGLLQNSRAHIARHQILAEVSRHFGETVNFVVPEDDGMNYIDRVETDWPFRIQLPIGTHVPFHCTASGKCFLSSLSTKERERLVGAMSLEPLTDKTLTNPDQLLPELKQIKSRGYSLDCEEFVEGMVAAAVPVCDPSGRFMAALAVHGPTQRIEDVEALAQSGILQRAAERLTDTLLNGEEA